MTTSTKVTVWDAEGCNAVFTSGSEGIVAAKRAKDGSVLAIADSQVVMLHRIEEGQDKSYRLKGTQVSLLGDVARGDGRTDVVEAVSSFAI